MPRLTLFLSMVAAMSCPIWVTADEPPSWVGEWQVMWRGGTALISLEQSGDAVTGFAKPQGGLFSGRTVGRALKGTWTRGERILPFEFVMTEDGRTFTGRYGKTEYFNGQRTSRSDMVDIGWSTTPRDSLRALITAVNRWFNVGDAAAFQVITKVLVFEGGESTLGADNRRYSIFRRLLDMSTFRIFEAPITSEESDRATYPIGPAGSNERYELRFRLENGLWKIVVDSEAALAAAERRFLADLGYASYSEYRAARSAGPRQTMRDFILGTQDWHGGGKERVLATMDLSFLPEHLRGIEGPILADYLKQIIDRAGYVIWQEIPDDPGRPLPYVHYQHPVGSLIIERKVGSQEEPDRWLFSAQTLLDAPALLSAMQNMPIAEGLSEPVPLTRFFRLRERLRSLSPALVKRSVRLENWQWLALAVGLLLAIAAARLAGWLTLAIPRLLGSHGEHELPAETASKFDWPVRVAVAGLVVYYAYAALGLADGGLTIFGRLAALVLAVGLGFLLFRLVGAVGGYFTTRTAGSSTYFDEIVVALATGLTKLLIVVFTIVVCADIVSLPYEGIVAGLGLGGLALAFASRETLSNMFGAIMLLADRPFKRGDLIETDGNWATVEGVGLRSTRLRTFDDSLMIIPNAQLSDKAIINWGIRRRRKILLTIALKYSTPREKLDQFVAGLRDVYEAQPRADTSEFYVGLKEFGPSSLDIEFWGYFRVYGYRAQLEAQHALMGDIVDWAKKVGVSFAFPTRSIQVEQAIDAVPTLRRAAE